MDKSHGKFFWRWFVTQRTYTISDLTALFDVTARTLRYYEEMGLLTPKRRGTQRLYRERDKVRIQLILRGRRLGFSLEEIRDMLILYDADPTEVTQLREVIHRGDEKLAQVEAQIQELQAVREELLEWRGKMQQTLTNKMKEEKQA
ncbi:MerR family DNA-binding transcriptional regulator [Alicyclobacillaceae bacterium I2511]|nr:MerR family DNA-binding transcriptional regulator [Alicyclobacillaceae bacterium I2511]